MEKHSFNTLKVSRIKNSKGLVNHHAGTGIYLRNPILIVLGIFFFSLFLSPSLKAQQLPADSLIGMESYNRMDYSNALTYLLRYNKKKPTRRNIFAIADCYRHIQNYTQAEVWYKKAIDLGKVPSKVRFYYAETLQSNGKYYKAIKQYILTKPVDEFEVKLTERRIYSCVMADSIAKLIPNRFEIHNAKDINSDGSDFGMVPFNKGKIFISDRLDPQDQSKHKDLNKNIYHWTDRAFLKMYYLEQDSLKGTSTISPYKEIIKTQYHVGPLVFNKKQDLVFYTQVKKVNPKNITSNKSLIKDFVNRLEIYYSKKINGVWSDGVPLPFNNILQYSVGHPALSPDEKLLYFSSDMPGGKGGTDIYYCEMGNGTTFGKPVNAGSVINTEGNEVFPVFQPSGDLYFSSDGLMGLGGLDIFRTHGEKTSWLKPANLGSPVNSSKDDFSFLAQGRDVIGGYFTSNRDGGSGSDDFYYFSQIKPLPPLESPDGVKMNQDSLLYAQVQKDEFPKDSIEYLQAYSPELRSKIQAGLDSANEKSSKLKKLKFKPKDLYVNNVGHLFGEYHLDSLATKEVDSVSLVLLNNPLTHLEIVGHADIRGPESFNFELSRKRALEIYKRILKLGINKKRLKVSWVGIAKPLVPCPVNSECTEEQYAQNRRSEMKISGLSSTQILVDQNEPDSSLSRPDLKSGLIPKYTIKSQKELPIAVKINGGDSMASGKAKIVPDKITEEDLKILQNASANQNELFNAFGEMTIDTVYLNSRNLLVIRETDGTIQRIFLPKSVLEADNLIRDQAGNQWIIRRNRRVIKIKKQ